MATEPTLIEVAEFAMVRVAGPFWERHRDLPAVLAAFSRRPELVDRWRAALGRERMEGR